MPIPQLISFFNTAEGKQQQKPDVLFSLPLLSSPSLLYPALCYLREKGRAGPGLEKHPCAQQRTLWDHPQAGAGKRPHFPPSQPGRVAGTPQGLVYPPVLQECGRCRQERTSRANQEPKHLGQVVLVERKELDHQHSSVSAKHSQGKG